MDIKDFFFKMKPLQTDAILDDSTLRDGIQMPGLAAGPKHAAKIAKLLSEIGVERIEISIIRNQTNKLQNSFSIKT